MKTIEEAIVVLKALKPTPNNDQTIRCRTIEALVRFIHGMPKGKHETDIFRLWAIKQLEIQRHMAAMDAYVDD